MKWFRNKKGIALVISIVLLLSATVGTTLAYVVTQSPSLMNLFIPGFESTGDIILSKEVEHPFGLNYRIPDDVSFTFDVSLGESYASKTILSSAGSLTADESGVITVSLKPGASIELTDILSGTSVSISERQDRAGFTTSEAVKTLTVGRLNDTPVDFVNIYQPEAAVSNLAVTGVKLISGRDWLETDSFTFRLDVKKNDAQYDWTYLGEKTISYDASNAEFNCFDVSDLISYASLNEVGTYIFRLSEVAGTLTGMSSDAVTFEVYVTDLDMDGRLEISGVNKDGVSIEKTENQYVFDVTIVNEYLPAGSDDVLIQIHKELEDLSGQNMTPAGFTFTLYDDAGNVIQSSSATSSTGDTSIRLHFGADDAGKEYKFVLKEDQGLRYGMTYDQKEVPFEVSVVDNYDGTVSAFIYEEKTCEEMAVLIESEDSEMNDSSDLETSIANEQIETVCRIPDQASDTYSVSFKNTYDPDDVQVVISGDKDLTGRNLNANEFTFDLIYQGNVIDSVSHDQEGYFEFDSINYSKTGTYVYTVKENLVDLPGGIEPDTSEYQVIVTVSDYNGVLNASKTILDKNSNESEIKFVNEYTAKEAEVVLSGIKSLDGKEIESEDFIFELYETDSTFALGAVKETVYNNAQGEFKFKTLKFSDENTYYYVVKENSSKAPMNGVTYDESLYQIEIHVYDGQNGFLMHDLKMNRINESEIENVSSILFENSYDAKDAVVTFKGEKVLNGLSIEDGMFRFHLYETDDTFGYDSESEPLKKTTNDASGAFAFDALTFDEETTKYYVIAENQSHKIERVEYDDRIYEITVKVEDKNGVLEAVVTGADNIQFVNTFVPEPSDLEIYLKAHKTVYNTGDLSIGPENFQFMLEQKNTDNKSIVKSDESGNAVFVLNYSEEDSGKVFEYKMSEVNDGKDGVTYSTKAYNLSVEISLENNTLKAELKVEGEKRDEVICEFENTYHKLVESSPEPTVKPQKPASNTGDESNVILYALLAFISLILIVVLMVLKKINTKKAK